MDRRAVHLTAVVCGCHRCAYHPGQHGPTTDLCLTGLAGTAPGIQMCTGLGDPSRLNMTAGWRADCTQYCDTARVRGLATRAGTPPGVGSAPSVTGMPHTGLPRREGEGDTPGPRRKPGRSAAGLSRRHGAGAGADSTGTRPRLICRGFRASRGTVYVMSGTGWRQGVSCRVR